MNRGCSIKRDPSNSLRLPENSNPEALVRCEASVITTSSLFKAIHSQPNSEHDQEDISYLPPFLFSLPPQSLLTVTQIATSLLLLDDSFHIHTRKKRHITYSSGHCLARMTEALTSERGCSIGGRQGWSGCPGLRANGCVSGPATGARKNNSRRLLKERPDFYCSCI